MSPDTSGGGWRFGPVAGLHVWSDGPLPIPWLVPSESEPPSHRVPEDSSVSPSADRLIFEGRVQVDEHRPYVTCQRRGDLYRVQIDGWGRAAVERQGAVTVARVEPQDRAAVSAEPWMLLGPTLLLALALNRIYCFHGSGCRFGERAAVFLGPSGAGKSTLARYLSERRVRIADDLLPFTDGSPEPNGLLAAPRFPQPKLPAERQYPATAPAHLPLAAAFALEPAEELACERLRGSRALTALIEHVAASALFDGPLQAGLLDVIGASGVRVFRLRIPHRRDELPRVEEEILKAVGGMSGDDGGTG